MIEERRTKFNTIAIAILICANPIGWIFSFIPNILAFLIIIAGVLVLMVNNNIPQAIPAFILIFLCIFSVNFLIAPSNDDLRLYFSFFIILGIFGFSFGFLEFNYKLLYKYLTIISLLLVPVMANMDMGDPEYESIDYGNWMGISYGTLRLVIVLILMLSSHKLSNIIVRMIIIAALIFYIMFYLSYASRGAILSIIAFIFFLYIINKNYSQKKLIVLFFTISVIGLFILLNFGNILIALVSFLGGLNIHILFLEKTLAAFLSESLSNGRDSLIQQGIEGIMMSPFLGNGIASFEAIYNGYVHNVFIQVYYELGILPFLILIGLVVYSIVFIFNREQPKEERLFLAYLFCSGVVELFFSSTYWRSQIFWLYLGYIVCLIIKHKPRRIIQLERIIGNY